MFGGGGGAASDSHNGSPDGGAGGYAGGAGGAGGVGGLGGGGGGGAGLGGAVFSTNVVFITNSTLANNAAIGGAGGAATGDGQAGTAGRGLGGAVFTWRSDLSTTGSTIAGGTADAGGGVFVLAQFGTAHVVMDNTIVADSAGGASDFETATLGDGAFLSLKGSNDLVEKNSATNGFPSGATIITGQDPLLGPLADNGGPTDTLALLPGSPAIDAGAKIGFATDQRGRPRVADGGSGQATADIGAYERSLVPTTITVVASDPSPTYGESVTFTATVTGGAGPTGTVQFFIDGAPFGDVTPLVGGQAVSAAYSAVTLGAHTVTAAYTSDADFASGSGTLEGGAFAVRAPTTTAVSSSTDSTTFRVGATFTAVVSSEVLGLGAPDGDVVFYDTTTGATLGTAILIDGTATLPPSPAVRLDVGSHQVAARYGGSPGFFPSDSGPQVAAVSVDPAPTSIGIDVVAQGQAARLSAIVTSSAGLPDGSVDFFDLTTNTDLGTVPLAGFPASAALVATLGVGSHAVTATYLGTANFAVSSAQQTYVVQNLAPTDITLSSTSVAENQPADTVVGAFSTTDPNTGDSFTYTLVGGLGDNASFTIDDSGHLLTAASFDYEGQSSYVIRVRSTDAGKLFVEKAFTISVLNADETTATIKLSSTSVAEHQPAGTLVGTFSALDPDAGDRVTYSLVAGLGDDDNSSFTIDPAGNLRTAASFDAAANSSYAIRVRARDTGGLATEQAFTIRVVGALLTVDSLGDDSDPSDNLTTLREAIAEANTLPGNSVIVFDVSGLIRLTGPLPALSGNIDIEGPGADRLTVQGQTGGNYRIFTVQAGATVSISGLAIDQGSADVGGGILNAGTLTVADSLLVDNSATNGGGIYNQGALRVSGTTFSDNTASDSGGGIYDSTGTATVLGSTLSNNTATQLGGGIRNAGGTTTVTGSTLRDNSAGLSGGAISNDATLTVTASTLSNNSAVYGGGIINEGALTITASTLSANSASSGGGIWNFSTATVTGSLFNANRADFGGGILLNSGTLTLTDSTLSGNSANVRGGGIFNGGALTVNDSTLSDNSASGAGGGIYTQGSATLNNSIVANSGAGGDVSGTLGGNRNLVEDGSGGLADTIVADPKLGPLAHNGGGTLTRALLPGSPAIDAGRNDLIPAGVVTDQRGVKRVLNSVVDLGAYEVDQGSRDTTLVVLSSIPDQTVAAGHSVTVTLSATDPLGLPLTYSAVADSQAHALRVRYGLHTDGNYIVNWGGQQEKWIKGNGGTWFFLLPSGSLYQWDGSHAASGVLIANLGASFYADPTLLTNAQPVQVPATLSVSGNVLTITAFLSSFAVTVTVSDGQSSDSQTFNVTVTTANQPPVLQSVPDQSGLVNHSLTVALSATDAEGDPLTYSAVADSQAHALKVKYGLHTDGNYYFNYGGQQDRWVMGSGGSWFFVLPDGSLYRWDGTSGQATGTLIANVGPAAYADPTVLTNAQPGQAPAAVSVSGNVLTITPSAGFVGTFTVTATVSDGHGTDSESFNVTVSSNNRAPVLQALPDQSGAANKSLTVTLSATDADGDPLTYSAVADSQAHALKVKYGLHTDGNYYFNYGGQQDRWVMGGGGTWFFVLPDGSLYLWDGTANKATGTLIANVGPAAYADPTLLTNAQPGQAPAAVSVSGNVLTITPNAGFVGSFYVTATASDGLASDVKTFKVTVS
jgi:predicted outer membrane repeat protein